MLQWARYRGDCAFGIMNQSGIVSGKCESGMRDGERGTILGENLTIVTDG